MVLLGVVVVVLALYTVFHKRKSFIASSRGGCDHTLDANGVSACPHGVDVRGGCNMNITGIPGPGARLSGKPLDWVLPKGWATEAAEGGLRAATMKPAGPGKASVAVIVLPGRAGGELANVNRWRGQIGLSPIGDQELASLRRSVVAKAGPVSIFDLDNPKEPDGRMVVGILGSDSDTWFVKLTGDRTSVARTKPAFLKLLESLRPREAVS
jgi:hypothetical protein